MVLHVFMCIGVVHAQGIPVFLRTMHPIAPISRTAHVYSHYYSTNYCDATSSMQAISMTLQTHPTIPYAFCNWFYNIYSNNYYGINAYRDIYACHQLYERTTVDFLLISLVYK